MISGEIIIVDDEDDVREAYAQTLRLEGLQVKDFSSAVDALEAVCADWPGVVFTDLRMPKMDGLELLDKIRLVDRDIPVVMVTAHGDVPIAVSAMRQGAYDFLEKPPNPLHLLEVVQRALKHRQLVLDNRQLRARLAEPARPLDAIVGETAIMVELRKTTQMLAAADVDTLIVGDTGTGKELVARALHACGPRAGQKFVALNCAALPENLIESELFGHEKGAFTNAHTRRIGKLEYADKGVLFLDEIESMPLAIQVKLLRVLQERSFERIGSNESVTVDLTVVAATKGNLAARCQRGEFRSDLYYRLNVAAISIPALAERIDDLPLLFSAFVQQAAIERGKPAPNIAPQVIAQLMRHDWPGNIRELKNVAAKFVLDLPLGIGELDGALRQVRSSGRKAQSLAEMTEQFEKQALTTALIKTSGRIADTAKLLQLPRKTLYLRMQKHGLRKEDFRGAGNDGHR